MKTDDIDTRDRDVKTAITTKNTPSTKQRKLTQAVSWAGTAATFAAPAAIVLVANGMLDFPDFAAAFTGANPIKSMALATSALAGAVGLFVLRHRANTSRQEQSDNRILERLQALTQQAEEDRQRQENDRRRQEDCQRLNEEMQETIMRLLRQLQRNESRHLTTNTPEVWGNQAPNSKFMILNPQSRGDVTREFVDGQPRLIPNIARIKEWLRRYGINGVGRANLICFEDGGDNVPDQIAFLLTAFRTLIRLAEVHNVRLRLDRVHFYLREKSAAKNTIAIGEYSFGGPTVPFAITYTDWATSYSIPRTLLDDKVELYYDQTTISGFRDLCEALIAGRPSISLRQLEERFGHLVPMPHFNAEDIAGLTLPDLPEIEEDEDLIINGDHISVTRRNTMYR